MKPKMVSVPRGKIAPSKAKPGQVKEDLRVLGENLRALRGSIEVAAAKSDPERVKARIAAIDARRRELDEQERRVIAEAAEAAESLPRLTEAKRLLERRMVRMRCGAVLQRYEELRRRTNELKKACPDEEGQS